MIERTDEHFDKVKKYSVTNNKSFDITASEKDENNVSIPSHYLNYGQEEQMEIYGYEKCYFRTYCTTALYILTLGLLRLIYHWYPRMMLYSTHRRCSLSKAQKVLILENYLGKHKTYFVKDVQYLSTNSESSTENENKSQTMKIFLENGTQKELQEMKVVRCKKMCYVWDPTEFRFFRLVGLDTNQKNSDLHKYNGFTRLEEQIQHVAYGKNLILISVQSIPTLLCLEILNPFYIFQIFAIIVWLMEGYYYYNLAIFAMSVFGISSSIIQTRRNQLNLCNTVESVDKVITYRGKDPNTNEDITEEIDSTDLVPGDVIIIPETGCIMQSDCVLLKGGTCVVNESMLTGESVPVIKTPLTDTSRNIYNVRHDSNHTLYCGTKIIQTRQEDEKIMALVIRTGYLTTKGQLVRSILYPPPVDFKFDRDSYKFIGILAFVAFCGFLYTVIYKARIGTTVFDVIIKALDLVTICIPPALPAAMTVGKIYALHRLMKKQIFCINSRVINVSGSLDCVCFDKTGTLTEDGLDVWGAIPIEKDSKQSTKLTAPLRNPGEELSLTNHLLYGMITCHSVNLIDGELSGDPLDVKMFEATKWNLEETYDQETNQRYGISVPRKFKSPTMLQEIGVVNQYQFTSNLQRMSVITKNPSEKYCRVYVKGSPEKIMASSKKETIPENLFDELDVYTRQGYRVIAMGTKTLSGTELSKIKNLERDDVESDLEFVGLLILENRLKPETTGVIDILKRAKIKIAMVTGDNIETAISVARECEIIEPKHNVVIVNINKTEKEENDICLEIHGDSFKTRRKSQTCFNGKDIEKIDSDKVYALSGSTWKTIREKYPERIPALVKNGVVFARMSSDQKQQLVLELQALGYYVGMCGDGANDCGALKTAHAGISLSDTESSVASPFTSKVANISCVPKVIREGRAALITSFGIFKFMVAYSLTEFYSVILLYTFNTNLTDIEFLFIDICLILNFALFFGKTKAYKGPLYSTPPASSLFNIVPLTSVFSQIIIFGAFQMLSLYLITTYSWYEPFEFDPDNIKNYVSYENYAVFAMCLFQYILLAVTFSFGKPYRQRIYTNRVFSFSLILMTCICVYIVTQPAQWVSNILELKMPPMEFRMIIILLAFVNMCVSFIFEDLIVNLLIDRLTLLRRSNKLQIDDNVFSNAKHVIEGIDNLTFIDESNENKNLKNFEISEN